MAIFFTNRPRLESICPKRAEYLANMVAGWTPARTNQVITTSVTATGTGT